MARALRIAPLLALLSTTCGWGTGGKVCAVYRECCKAMLADGGTREIFEDEDTCYRYEEETNAKFCEKEWSRALGTAGGAGRPIPPECDWK